MSHIGATYCTSSCISGTQYHFDFRKMLHFSGIFKDATSDFSVNNMYASIPLMDGHINRKSPHPPQTSAAISPSESPKSSTQK
jgi:hypothetical protein